MGSQEPMEATLGKNQARLQALKQSEFTHGAEVWAQSTEEAKSVPYTFEEYFIKEREVYGTSRDDSLTSNETTVFGLNGNDSLYSTASTNYNFLFGGGGNDVYTMATGSALTIFDSGGIDRVIAEDLEFNDVNTYVLTIEGKHGIDLSS